MVNDSLPIHGHENNKNESNEKYYFTHLIKQPIIISRRNTKKKLMFILALAFSVAATQAVFAQEKPAETKMEKTGKHVSMKVKKPVKKHMKAVKKVSKETKKADKEEKKDSAK
jgi:hypothetical protein